MNLYIAKQLFLKIEDNLLKIELHDKQIELTFVDKSAITIDFIDNNYVKDYIEELSEEEQYNFLTLLANEAFGHIISAFNNNKTFCDLEDLIFKFCKNRYNSKKTSDALDDLINHYTQIE